MTKGGGGRGGLGWQVFNPGKGQMFYHVQLNVKHYVLPKHVLKMRNDAIESYYKRKFKYK